MGSIRLYVKIICKILSREVKIWLLLLGFKVNCLWCLRTLLQLKYQTRLVIVCGLLPKTYLAGLWLLFSGHYSVFLPPANEVAGRYCFHRCLSVILFSGGSPCDYYPWCIGAWVTPPNSKHGTYPPTPITDPTPLPPNTRHGTYPLPLQLTSGGHRLRHWTTDIWWSSLVTCSNLLTWGHTPAPSPPLVLTFSGGHWNTYVWQAGGTLPTGVLSCFKSEQMLALLFSTDKFDTHKK